MNNNNLFKEYELVQSKIDKIGEFKFKVKGWAVALVSAILIASASKDIPLIVFLAGFIGLTLFALLELHQNEWQASLSWRAGTIERHLRKQSLVTKEDAVFLTPGISISIRDRRKILDKKRFGFFTINANSLFYVLLAICLLLFTFQPSQGSAINRDPDAAPCCFKPLHLTINHSELCKQKCDITSTCWLCDLKYLSAEEEPRYGN